MMSLPASLISKKQKRRLKKNHQPPGNLGMVSDCLTNLLFYQRPPQSIQKEVLINFRRERHAKAGAVSWSRA
jgi:hypothetical protein